MIVHTQKYSKNLVFENTANHQITYISVFLLQHADKGFLHVVINSPIAGERPGTLDVARQLANHIRVLHLLVKVAYERPAGQMAARKLIEGMLFLPSRRGIPNRHIPCQAAHQEYHLDAVVIFLR